jgi:diguanylate cyclase (GGDEF)-like protein/PAS domain S-box-containing protein
VGWRTERLLVPRHTGKRSETNYYRALAVEEARSGATAMNDDALTVLLISDADADASLVGKALAGRTGNHWRLERVRRLSDGVGRLRKAGIAAVLLDLFLPDSQGVGTFEALFAAAPLVPILVITSRENEVIAWETTQRGAQDHLLKDHLDDYWLPRILRSVIGRKAGDEASFMEKERAQVTLNSIGDAVLSTDIAGNVTYLNTVAERMTGWSSQEAIGRPLTEVFRIIDGATRQPAPNPMAQAVQKNQTVGLTANCILIRRDGSESAIEDSAAPIHDRGGQVTGAVIVFHDVSAARAITQEMAHLAQHDFLTDLPNRMLIVDRIANTIALARRHGKRRAVLFLDLDGFKHINDSLGHPIGDQLLQSVAQRLRACVRSADTISRQGGDEFVVLLSEIEHAEDAARSAEKMLMALAAPHTIAGKELHITGSIGISIYPDDGRDAETLIRCADTAMYHAKDKGRNNCQFFTQEMNVRAVERQFLETNLRRALERREFVLHYQPKVDLGTQAITGVEALIRWRHPERGLIPPALFVPVAEECGLIVPIGRWVLHEACRQAQAWIDAGLAALPIAVNISAAEFQGKDFLEGVRATLEETRLNPRYLELELTESVLMQDADTTAAVLFALKALGVRLAIDDFGTGYSSLSYLRKFPIDTLKIDQSFVREITAGSRDDTIVSAIISMGKTLKQRVIAEGIETGEQLAFLQRQHCGEGQGYHFGRPVCAEDFAALLEARKEIMPRLPAQSVSTGAH